MGGILQMGFLVLGQRKLRFTEVTLLSPSAPTVLPFPHLASLVPLFAQELC